MDLKPKIKLPQQTEQQIMQSILVALAYHHPAAKFWRNNTGATQTKAGGFVRFGQVGSPDIMGILSPYGIFVGLEVKRPKGKVTDAQDAWIQQATLLGACCGVVHSVDEALELIGKVLKDRGVI